MSDPNLQVETLAWNIVVGVGFVVALYSLLVWVLKHKTDRGKWLVAHYDISMIVFGIVTGTFIAIVGVLELVYDWGLEASALLVGGSLWVMNCALRLRWIIRNPIDNDPTGHE